MSPCKYAKAPEPNSDHTCKIKQKHDAYIAGRKTGKTNLATGVLSYPCSYIRGGCSVRVERDLTTACLHIIVRSPNGDMIATIIDDRQLASVVDPDAFVNDTISSLIREMSK